MKLLPTDDRVVVKLEKAPEKSKGGIYIPQTAAENNRESIKGEVLAVGPGRLLDDGIRAMPWVQPGQVVLLPKYGGNPVTVGGEDYMIIHENEIIAVLE